MTIFIVKVKLVRCFLNDKDLKVNDFNKKWHHCFYYIGAFIYVGLTVNGVKWWFLRRKKNTNSAVCFFIFNFNEIRFLLNLLELKSKKCELFSLPLAGTFRCPSQHSTFNFFRRWAHGKNFNANNCLAGRQQYYCNSVKYVFNIENKSIILMLGNPPHTLNYAYETTIISVKN